MILDVNDGISLWILAAKSLLMRSRLHCLSESYRGPQLLVSMTMAYLHCATVAASPCDTLEPTSPLPFMQTHTTSSPCDTHVRLTNRDSAEEYFTEQLNHVGETIPALDIENSRSTLQPRRTMTNTARRSRPISHRQCNNGRRISGEAEANCFAVSDRKLAHGGVLTTQRRPVGSLSICEVDRFSSQRAVDVILLNPAISFGASADRGGCADDPNFAA